MWFVFEVVFDQINNEYLWLNWLVQWVVACMSRWENDNNGSLKSSFFPQLFNWQCSMKYELALNWVTEELNQTFNWPELRPLEGYWNGFYMFVWLNIHFWNFWNHLRSSVNGTCEVGLRKNWFNFKYKNQLQYSTSQLQGLRFELRPDMKRNSSVSSSLWITIQPNFNSGNLIPVMKANQGFYPQIQLMLSFPQHKMMYLYFT